MNRLWLKWSEFVQDIYIVVSCSKIMNCYAHIMNGKAREQTTCIEKSVYNNQLHIK